MFAHLDFVVTSMHVRLFAVLHVITRIKRGESHDQKLESLIVVLRVRIYTANIGEVSASVLKITFQRFLLCLWDSNFR